MAGINGAGVNGAGINGAGIDEAGAARLFSATARAQYAATGALRWHMFINGLRSKMGAFELGARTVAFVIYAGMGLGMGFGAGIATYFLISSDEWKFVPIVLWAVCIIWQLLPILLASFQEQFDLSTLLRFPVSFSSYTLLYLIFGLADISTMVGAILCFGIWVGIVVAWPTLFAWSAIVLLVFAAFNILLARAVFAWIDRWLAQRKTREILGAVFLVLMLSLQFLNPALHQRRHQGREQRDEAQRQMMAQYGPWLHKANAVQKWLPPGLAEGAVQQAAQEGTGQAFESMGLLGLYALAVGGVLAARLKSEYRGENLGSAPSRKKAGLRQLKGGQAKVAGWMPGGSGPVAAVIEKEIRLLLRSLPILYALGAPLLLVFIFATMFHNTSQNTGHPMIFALPLGLAYAMIGFTQLFYNHLGAEGPGIQLLFLSPTPIRTVFLAKNLFHSMIFGIDAVVVCTLVSLRMGMPQPAMLAATLAWLLFALPTHLAAGNIFSILFPYRVNPGRISRQRGSQGNALLSLLIQAVVLGAGAGVFALCSIGDRLWLAVPIFLVLAGGAFFAWSRVLQNADAMANRHKESLMETVMKTA